MIVKLFPMGKDGPIYVHQDAIRMVSSEDVIQKGGLSDALGQPVPTKQTVVMTEFGQIPVKHTVEEVINEWEGSI